MTPAGPRVGRGGAGRRLAAHAAAATTRAVATAVLAGGTVLAAAGPAAGHNSLVSSTPPAEARVDSGPAAVEFVFDQPVRSDFSAVVVTGPDGGNWARGEPTVVDATVTQPLRPLGPAGVYRADYRVVSADGHPVSGTVRFTLTAAVLGPQASPSAPAAGDVPAASADGDRGLAWWALPAAGFAATGLVVVLGAAAARRRSADRSRPAGS